jgi:membrane fusion protein (multidrug efflux system)
MTLLARISLVLVTIAAPLFASEGPPTAVMVSKAERKPVADRIEALGTLRANEAVELTATVTERVVETGFEDGDRVKKGDVLLKLSSTEEEALLTEAVSAEKESRLQYERIEQLASRGTASTSQLDEARRVHETSRARQLAIESRLAELIIKAPFDGVVGLRNISVGALVRPGDQVTTIDDDSKMLLDFSVPARFLDTVKLGSPIEASTATYGGRFFHGGVHSVSSRVDPVTRSVMVRAEIPNEDRLLMPGMLMKVDLLARPREAVVVPEGSLLPVGDRNFVMVIRGAPDRPVANRREIEIGTRRRGEVEVVSGLAEGETVVAHGGFKLSDGAAVRVISGISEGQPTSNEK